MLKILLGYIEISNFFFQFNIFQLFSTFHLQFLYLYLLYQYQKDFEDQSLLSFKRRIMLHLFFKSVFLCLLFLEVDSVNKYGEFDIKDLETSQVFIYYRWTTLGTIHILLYHL